MASALDGDGDREGEQVMAEDSNPDWRSLGQFSFGDTSLDLLHTH